jgi:hypothetical protein
MKMRQSPLLPILLPQLSPSLPLRVLPLLVLVLPPLLVLLLVVAIAVEALAALCLRPQKFGSQCAAPVTCFPRSSTIIIIVVAAVEVGVARLAAVPEKFTNRHCAVVVVAAVEAWAVGASVGLVLVVAGVIAVALATAAAAIMVPREEGAVAALWAVRLR